MNRVRENSVILVEDNDDDAALTKILLQKAGGVDRVLTLDSGEAAVEHLTGLVGRDDAALPLALVMDVKMPRMSGLELLGWIRQRRDFDLVPVVMLSSSDDPRDVARAAELGAQGYLGKYPPVPAVQGMLDEARTYVATTGRKPFFRVRANLLLGREALPDLGSA